MVDAMRHVKSAEEQDLIRKAAVATNAGTEAAVAAIADGAPETEAAAECLAAMTRAGGEPPGFGPFIRPQARLGEEHTTWGRGRYRAGETVVLELSGCVGRYHAPNGRLVQVGGLTDENREMAELSLAAFDAVVARIAPGLPARDVYAAWQAVVDAAGLAHHRRHHCGYMIGIGFPPAWTGGNFVTGLRHDSELVLETGMAFHILSWLMGTGRPGNFFVSNCVLLGDAGPEVLTASPAI